MQVCREVERPGKPVHHDWGGRGEEDTERKKERVSGEGGSSQVMRSLYSTLNIKSHLLVTHRKATSSEVRF